jgi:hypothetical protein
MAARMFGPPFCFCCDMRRMHGPGGADEAEMIILKIETRLLRAKKNLKFQISDLKFQILRSRSVLGLFIP